MSRMIFVNLPVSDVKVSRAFYTGLGFTVNEQFSDDQVTAIVVSDQIVVMLLERPRFEEFLQGTQVADAHSTTEVLTALSASSREEVDQLVERAVAHGGKARRPYTDDGMYGQSVSDPDGHVWEFFFMEGMG